MGLALILSCSRTPSASTALSLADSMLAFTIFSLVAHNLKRCTVKTLRDSLAQLFSSSTVVSPIFAPQKCLLNLHLLRSTPINAPDIPKIRFFRGISGVQRWEKPLYFTKLFGILFGVDHGKLLRKRILKISLKLDNCLWRKLYQKFYLTC